MSSRKIWIGYFIYIYIFLFIYLDTHGKIYVVLGVGNNLITQSKLILYIKTHGENIRNRASGIISNPLYQQWPKKVLYFYFLLH